MRLALVHPYAWPDVRRGGERYLDDLAWYFRKHGDDVDVITGTSGPSTRHDTPAGTDVGLRNRSPSIFRRRGLSTTETFGLPAFLELRGKNYDVVHTLVPSAAVAAHLARQPTLFTLLGHPEPDVFRDRPWSRRLFEWAIRRSEGIAALSEPAVSEAERAFGRRPIVLPPGVRMDDFAPDIGARTGAPRILFASALDQRQKGLDVLLGALDELLGTFPDARLALGGPGDGTWALSQASQRVRDAVDVIGAGEPDDLPARYRKSTVTVLPSRHEAFGLVLVESLACGTPVVGAIPGGPSDIVSDDVGRVVPFGDAKALADALRTCIELARDPQMPARCRERARNWDWDASVGPMHRAAYEDVVTRSRRPSRTV